MNHQYILHQMSQNLHSIHENIIDHYENPRNVGSLDKKNKNVGTGLVGAPACGDVMKVQLEVVDGVVVGFLKNDEYYYL